jgi:hypothetical protein
VIEGYPYLEKEMGKKNRGPQKARPRVFVKDEKFNDGLRGKLSSAHLEFG